MTDIILYLRDLAASGAAEGNTTRARQLLAVAILLTQMEQARIDLEKLAL